MIFKVGVNTCLYQKISFLHFCRKETVTSECYLVYIWNNNHFTPYRKAILLHHTTRQYAQQFVPYLIFIILKEVKWCHLRYSLFLTSCSRALTREWIAVFLVQSTYTRMLDSFTRVLVSFTRMFVTHTRKYEILASLLVEISNMLLVLRTRYEFTCKFFTFIIPPQVNIFID